MPLSDVDAKDLNPNLIYKAVNERRDLPPEVKTELLSSIIFEVTKAIERACLVGGTMSGYDILRIKRSLTRPVKSITANLKSLERDVKRYSWPMKTLQAYGDFDLSKP